MVRLSRLVVELSATLRTTVPLRSASESAPWMVMWTLRTVWAEPLFDVGEMRNSADEQFDEGSTFP
ncbi:MAG: hypothetical protein OXH38_05155 [Chloroflexi bacterium]|nr:hypothetical protein [Chloroflexota bacterium]MDE0655345.1 hypothetical protein [Acidimicrobiaceae bacterium]